MSLRCIVSQILSVIFHKLKRSRDSEYIPYRGQSSMRALVLVYISRHIKLEVLSFVLQKI